MNCAAEWQSARKCNGVAEKQWQTNYIQPQKSLHKNKIIIILLFHNEERYKKEKGTSQRNTFYQVQDSTTH